MNKYRSDFIRKEDLKIHTSCRCIDDTKTRIVEVEHIPSGFIVSSEDKSQMRAYNQAIHLLEDKISDLINSNA